MQRGEPSWMIMRSVMVVAAVGAVDMRRRRSRLGGELAGENDAAAFGLFGEVLGDLRMVGADVADQAVEKPRRLQPAT